VMGRFPFLTQYLRREISFRIAEMTLK
jgi:hypothetical protein